MKQQLEMKMTQRAKIALQLADDKLKQRIKAVLEALAGKQELPAEQVRDSQARPGVRVVRIENHRLFYRQEPGSITVLDILPRQEAYND